jgi:hypothetical protein
MTTVGFIGAGHIGGTVARLALAAGYDVVLSNSRTPKTLDDLVASLGAVARPSTTQLWPEHFDAACELTAAPGVRVAVGGSPGDAGHEAPYLYVSLGEVPKPTGDPYWNAPFGALLPAVDLQGVAHPEADAVAFLAHGLERLAAAAR